ncbi:phage portal protein [Mycolicibacterium senegalense]|uniref:phage portal protein n=1 Tax=Mycolicibacterium senegalense TaxID=1796 RepID=UPI003628FA50
MTNDLLHALLQKLDEPVAHYGVLEQYYAGQQPLAFLSPEAKAALGTRFGRMATNLCRVAVTSLTERLRVTGFTGAQVWADWLRNDLDEQSVAAHREALLLGSSYVITWADKFGRPKVTVETAKQMACLRDPGTRTLTAAVKRWETATTTEAIVYGPEVITRYRANQTGATTAGFVTVDEIANPLGVVPVVRLLNSDRILDEGCSEIEDILPLNDALNKVLTDLMVASEYTGRPRRWATGVELEEVPVLDDDGNETGETTEQNPYPEGTRMMIAEGEAAKFGQLDAADMGGYGNAVDVLLTQISAVSGLPAHYLGISHDNPASADALRASEASLTARAEARQAQFGRSWEDVARLIVGVRDGADPTTVDVRVQWADAATRSVAQEADAITKLYSAGLLPASYALKRLGYTDDEISDIHAARTKDSVANLDLSGLVK